ncbi:heme oxygenase [Bacillus sp. E214]|uniref:heme oxygenase n=1 Tax=Bacillus sp. E214 TaxID=2587156 RepID=UPI0011DF81E6|nr:heme oxygenase [Bacillus sp. E214]
MIVVQNKIKTKPGFAEKMAGRFTSGNELDKFKGFVKVEVLLTEGLTEYDEMSVNMYWEDEESFLAWKNSDSFKKAHKRPEGKPDEAKQDSPMLGSQQTTFRVASVKEAAPTK